MIELFESYGHAFTAVQDFPLLQKVVGLALLTAPVSMSLLLAVYFLIVERKDRR